MSARTHREAMQAFFAGQGIAARPQGDKLYVARRQGWNGCAAYVKFDAPDSTAWGEHAASLFAGCRLRVIPLEGGKNWDYCARVENEIMTTLEGGNAPAVTADELKASAARVQASAAAQR